MHLCCGKLIQQFKCERFMHEQVDCGAEKMDIKTILKSIDFGVLEVYNLT